MASSWTNTRNEYSIHPSSDFNPFKREAVRRTSFDGWNNELVPSAEMADAGFFYLGEGTAVKCAFCFGVITEWQRDDDPLEKHQNLLPLCLFAVGYSAGNVPFNEDFGESFLWVGGQKDRALLKVLPNSCAGNTEVRVFISAAELGFMNFDRKTMAHPMQSDMEWRLETFTDKWLEKLPTPEALADAGWFHLASAGDDATACYCCGGVSHNWSSMQDPWAVHASLFPHCLHVLLSKGHGFVDCIQRQMVDKKKPDKLFKVPPAEPDEEVPPGLACKFCCKNRMSIVFIPCGHVSSCGQCAALLRVCPTCNKSFSSYSRVSFVCG